MKEQPGRARLLAALSCLALGASCAYFNTVYNAKNYYREGRKMVTHDTLVMNVQNFDKAIEKATSIIVKYPNTRWVDDALFIMGAAYYFKGDYARGLEKLDFLITNYPGSNFNAEARYLIGLANYKLKKYGAAVNALKDILAERKFRNKALLVMLYAYYGNEDLGALYEVADTLLGRSLGYDDRRAVLRVTGMAQYKEERYDEALDTFTRLLAITREASEQRDLKLRIAETYLQLGMHEQCETFLVGETDPQFRDLLVDLYVKTGKVDEAMEICQDLAHGPSTEIAAEAFYQMAQIYEARDSIDNAVAYYDSALARAPGSEYGRQAKQRSEILKRIQVLSAEPEDSVRAQFLLAEIYFTDLNDLPQAIRGYEKVYHDHPTSKWAPKAMYAHLWIANRVYGDTVLAQDLARDLIDKYPRTEYAAAAQRMMAEIEPGGGLDGSGP